jgi:hypothetical protein
MRVDDHSLTLREINDGGQGSAERPVFVFLFRALAYIIRPPLSV